MIGKMLIIVESGGRILWAYYITLYSGMFENFHDIFRTALKECFKILFRGEVKLFQKIAQRIFDIKNNNRVKAEPLIKER